MKQTNHLVTLLIIYNIVYIKFHNRNLCLEGE